jgi:uncharacterized coiled-coil protein SlyX
MRKYIFVILIFLPVSLFLFSCIAREQQEWNDIKNSVHIEDILDFAAGYESGSLLGEINQRISELISSENNLRRLRTLAVRYPERENDFKERISELAFYSAFRENTIEALEEYIEEFAGYGRSTVHINQARAALNSIYLEIAREQQEVEWAEAFEKHQSEDIILPLQNFIDAHPDSGRRAEAEKIIGGMQNNSVYSDRYLTADATLDMIDAFILNFPGHKDINRAFELRENFIGDIYSFMQAGYITASGIGDSITRCRVIIENLTDSRLIVTTPYGVYLHSDDMRVQDMLIWEEVEIIVESKSAINAYINTLCMNIHRNIPNNTNHFTIALLDEDSPLINLVKILEENNSSFAVAQAAAWHITDNPGKVRILNTIVYQNGEDAITEADYYEALRITGLID